MWNKNDLAIYRHMYTSPINIFRFAHYDLRALKQIVFFKYCMFAEAKFILTFQPLCSSSQTRCRRYRMLKAFSNVYFCKPLINTSRVKVCKYVFNIQDKREATTLWHAL